MNVGSRHLTTALQGFDELASTLEDKKIAVFLDYDGTLTPIVQRPELAVLSEETRAVVRGLAARCTVAIVSGRDLADVRNLVDIEEIFFAGSHGFDISGPEGLNLQYQQRAEFLPILDRAEAELKETAGKVPGVLIERKKFSIAIHFRLASETDLSTVEAEVDKVHSAHPELRKAYGKKIFELQPDIEWHKGKAVLWLMEKLGIDSPDIVPIYIGDDVTDEDAFRTLEQRGLGVVVMETSRETHAHYFVKNPEEDRQLLEKLTAMLEERKG